MNSSLLSIALPKRQRAAVGTTILAGDVGGTKTRLALFVVTATGLVRKRSACYGSRDYSNLVDIIQNFCKAGEAVERLCIGVAGPVIQQRVITTNLPWILDARTLSKELAIPYVNLLNDLEAHAYGIGRLTPDDVVELQAGDPSVKGNAAIIAPGTGLGEAGLFYDGKHHLPFASEGGHCGFAPQTEFDWALLKDLVRYHKRVSWERLLSGGGIQMIYSFVRRYRHDDSLLPQSVYATTHAAAHISEDARGGCPLALETFALFERYLATECANLALKFKATAGIFIGGGIVAKNIDLFQPTTFNQHFLDVGRLRGLLEKIPVYIIKKEDTALEGAAYYGAYLPAPSLTSVKNTQVRALT